MVRKGVNHDEEILFSQQSDGLWKRREQELAAWVDLPKPERHMKQTKMLEHVEVDAQLHAALTLFKQMDIRTEFSCAGVSLLDEPVDHSLYAYITFQASARTERFIHYAMERMKNRLLVTFEPGRQRYDLSSFYIGHNRSFCMLIEHYAASFMLQDAYK